MQHIITALFLVAAIVFYALGAIGPGTAFVGIGALAEGVFWFRFLRSKSRN
ncbi:MAG: hypothetical protein O3A13_06145 [Proteobacteria bacterium]|nr:hypothetical protein [Pseudomonadota bacterium]MDA0993196.1 hypothetical protein [Pseudomonadota bacterium]